MLKWPLSEVAEVAAASFVLALSVWIKPDEMQTRQSNVAMRSLFKPYLGDKCVVF